MPAKYKSAPKVIAFGLTDN